MSPETIPHNRAAGHCRRLTAAAAACALLAGTVQAADTGHIPSVGVDTAGVFLLRNRSTSNVGWEFDAFRDAVKELGAQFLVDHYLEVATGKSLEENRKTTLERLDRLGVYLDNSGIDFFWNLETANWVRRAEYEPGVNLFEPEPGLHYFNMPPEVLERYAAHPQRRYVVFDEFEHMQMNQSRFMFPQASGAHPAIADTRQMQLPEAYEAILSQLVKIKAEYSAQNVQPVVETVWPSMHTIFARAGWTLSPKVLKESWTPVPIATAMGAALEYRKNGADLWLNPDLWFCGHYPGHSIDAFRSALLFSHWMGVSHFYAENMDFVNVRGVIHQSDKAKGFDYSKATPGKAHPDAVSVLGSLVFYPDSSTFTLTPYGEVFRWYAKEYRTQNPVPYTWEDALCDVAIVRFPDGDWGQQGSFFKDTLLGSDVAKSTEQTRAWISIWHLLSRETIPLEGLSFHARGVKYQQGPRFFVPSPATLVFDHRVGDELPGFDFRGAKVVFLTGIAATPATLETAYNHALNGNTVISLPHLLPQPVQLRWDRHADKSQPLQIDVGRGQWIITDNFLHQTVRSAVQPVLPAEDEMVYRFGEHRLVFRNVDNDRVMVELNGKVVSPVVETPSKRAVWTREPRLVEPGTPGAIEPRSTR